MTAHPRQVDRYDFAAYVALYRERFGADRFEAFEAVSAALDGWLLHPFTSAEALRIWLMRGSHHVQVYRRKAAIEQENRHAAIFAGVSSAPPDDGEGEGGGASIVPSATDRLRTSTRREARQLDRDERDRFIRQTIEAITERVTRDPEYATAIIRHYAELLADRV